MECGKLTAKLRDAVPVIFIEDGKEIKRLKNIEIPDEIKKLQYKGFTFDVPVTGAITFKIFFEPGTLPEVWPEPRARKQRTAKEVAPVEKTPDPEPATMEIEYHITGDRRKELVAAISAFLEIKAEYLAMPTRAYKIGEYMVSAVGTLTGPENRQLREMLEARGF